MLDESLAPSITPRSTLAILFAAVSVPRSPIIMKAVEQAFETCGIVESFKARPVAGLDLIAILQPLATDTANILPFVLRIAQLDRCAPLFETLSSINGFIKEGASHALRHGISDLQTKAKHYRDKLREHLAEAQSEGIHSEAQFVAAAKDVSMNIESEWRQPENMEGSTRGTVGFEGYVQQENESSPSPTAPTNPKTPPPTAASSTLPQPPQPTIASVRGTVIIGNQNTVNITCDTANHDSRNATTTTVADSANNCSSLFAKNVLNSL